MPSLGADMEAGTLVQWLKQPGDALARGDVIAVVDTDKGAIEIEVFEADAESPVGRVQAREASSLQHSAGAGTKVECALNVLRSCFGMLEILGKNGAERRHPAMIQVARTRGHVGDEQVEMTIVIHIAKVGAHRKMRRVWDNE